ncbi:MAG: hypothetical protein H0W78_04850 [Planctomycetes bacterium]|nr:hypothetical protein [Planctomycetota bacterium]
MSATFACPHCGASYPRKPVLVGRAVRCTTCKNAFRLREDGIADKVELEAPAPAQPTPAPVAAPQPSAPTPAPKAEAPAKPAGPKLPSSGWGLNLDVEVEEPAAVAKPAAAPAKHEPPPASFKSPLPKEAAGTPVRKSERMTAQQLEARRAMSATLAGSMTAALKSEAVKREEQGEKTKAKTEGRVGKIGPAVLTGQGVEEAKSNRLLLLGTLGVVALVAAVYWLLFTDSPERAGINAFTAEVEPARIRAGERVPTIQARAWLTGLPPAFVGVPPLIEMRDARIGSTRTINLLPAKDLFASLKGLVPVEPGPVWVPPERMGAVDDLRRPDQKPEAFIAAVLKREKKAISHPAFLDDLTKTGMSKEDADIVDLFIRGRTGNDTTTPDAQATAADNTAEKPAATDQPTGPEKSATPEKPTPTQKPVAAARARTVDDQYNAIVKRWMAGEIPTSMQVTRFFGSRGTMLLSRGQSFKTAEVEYDGRLVHFTGTDWPQEWKVLTITTKMKQRF